MSTKTNGTVKSSANSSVHNSISNLAVEKYTVGQQIVVGSRKVEIINYLTEGGFAQIYLVKFVELLNEFNAQDKTLSLQNGDLLCLKRVMVFDENGLNEMRNEVDVMKLLSGKPNVVQYFDSNASRNSKQQGGFEVLLLIEYCPNKSLLDYMNQRLTTKLLESEVLKIMYDITLGIAQLHYLDTPLIHRDIKIENVLVDAQNNFKLCDFGSTAKCAMIPFSHQEIALLSQDIYIHTTPQYRSPEMIDLYRYLPINEKSDIWALGIFLYKLLFYTTPFELTGQYAILHSKYDIPTNKYSPQLVNLIVIMLSENPHLRPNIYQVLFAICSILKTDVPLADKYLLGPYDFERFVKFQNKTQAIQKQLINQEQKMHRDSNNSLNDDTDLLNDLYLSYFEISSKFNLNNNLKPSFNSFNINNPDNKLVDGTDKNSHSEDKLSRHTTHTIDSSKSNPINIDDSVITSITTTFPGTNEFNKEDFTYYTEPKNSSNNNRLSTSTVGKTDPQRQRSIGSYASSAQSYNSAISTNFYAENNINTNNTHNSISSGKENKDIPSNVKNHPSNTEVVKSWTKQHKSNNPFPNISKSSTPISSTIFTDQTNMQQKSDSYLSRKRLSDGTNNIVQSVPMTNQLSQTLPPPTAHVPIIKPQQQQQTSHGPLLSAHAPQQQPQQTSHISMTSVPPITTTGRTIFNDGNLTATQNTNSKPIQLLQGVANSIPFPPAPNTKQINVLDSNLSNINNYTGNKNGGSYTDNSMISSPLFDPMKTSVVNQKYSSNPFPYIPSNTTIVAVNNGNVGGNGNNNHNVLTPTKINKNNDNDTFNDNGKYTSNDNDNTAILIELSPLRDSNATKENTIKDAHLTNKINRDNTTSSSTSNDNSEGNNGENNNDVIKNIISGKTDNDSEEHSISEITKTKKTTRPLEFSFNEMNLSQDSSLNINGESSSNMNIGRNDLEMEESFVSLSSSESIQLRLDKNRRTEIISSDDQTDSQKISTIKTNVPIQNMPSRSNTYKTLKPIRTQSLRNQDKTKRHSLDLEYQEIDFSTGSFPHSYKGTNASQTTSNLSFSSTANDNHASSRGHSSDKTQLSGNNTRHNRHLRTSGTASPKVRQSLDMERIKQEALLHNNNPKRKSFFSLFKNEK